jgi:WD40 repeat protein
MHFYFISLARKDGNSNIEFTTLLSPTTRLTTSRPATASLTASRPATASLTTSRPATASLTTSRPATASVTTIRSTTTSTQNNEDSFFTLKYLRNGLLACGSFGIIGLLNVTSLTWVMLLDGHTEIVSCFAELSDNLLVSGSYDKQINFWDISSKTLIRTIKDDSEIYDLIVLNNNTIISGSSLFIKIWNIDGTLIKSIQSDSNRKFVMMPNGLLACATFFVVQFLNTSDWSIFRTLTGHSNYVTDIALLPNGNLASASYDSTIVIWDTKNYSIKLKIQSEKQYFEEIAVISNDYLLSVGDKYLNLWNMTSGQNLFDYYFDNDYAYTLALIPNKKIAIGLANGIKFFTMNF